MDPALCSLRHVTYGLIMSQYVCSGWVYRNIDPLGYAGQWCGDKFQELRKFVNSIMMKIAYVLLWLIFFRINKRGDDLLISEVVAVDTGY